MSAVTEHLIIIVIMVLVPLSPSLLNRFSDIVLIHTSNNPRIFSTLLLHLVHVDQFARTRTPGSFLSPLESTPTKSGPLSFLK